MEDSIRERVANCSGVAWKPGGPVTEPDLLIGSGIVFLNLKKMERRTTRQPAVQSTTTVELVMLG